MPKSLRLLSLIGYLAIISSSHAQEDTDTNSISLRGGRRRRLQESLQQTQALGEPSKELSSPDPENGGEPQEPPPQQPALTEQENKEKQMRSYLGGLYPSVDSNMCPLNLRDILDMTSGYTMDMYSGGGQPVLRNKDLAFFWHIPRSGGSTMKNILNYCYDLRRAEKLDDEASMEYVRNNVLNMDTTSPKGLAVSFKNDIVNSNMIDVIVSNYFLSGSALFNDKHHGKAFTILRHPVELSASLFFQRRKYIEAWKSMTFHDYVKSDAYLDSWMTRQLTGTMPWVSLTEAHLEQAKNVMKTKIFVGVLNEMPESLRQMRAHFGWEEKEQDCEKRMLQDPASVNDHPAPPARGSPPWKAVIEKEKWDMALYYYGLELFAEQRNRYPPKDINEALFTSFHSEIRRQKAESEKSDAR